ncbi:cell division protein FtsL [mine drainage metagenome]|uniref:Cell division protein FtsL n=1 Tax=mine drainage metagenome TaxID=410659 RepID=A0A1J5PJ01_9ZZZZ
MLAVVLTALYLVNVQYQSRQLFFELDQARGRTHKLDIENQRLEIEKRTLATSARIERLARSRLQMRSANPSITTYVTDTRSAAVPAVAPAATIKPSGSGAAP